VGRHPRHRLELQKKTAVALERDQERVQAKRGEFLALQKALDTRRLIFVDESGFRLGSPPRYGWAPVGEKSPGKTVQGHWRTMTMLGAIGLDGFRGFLTIDLPTTAEVFLAFVTHQLVPKLRRGDIVVMDNLSAHKHPAAVAAIRAAEADVLFLPPYSPEFNPIEKVWSKLKDILRRLPTLCRDTFDQAVAFAMDAITNDDISAWTLHAGYDLAST
jgi:transposase